MADPPISHINLRRSSEVIENTISNNSRKKQSLLKEVINFADTLVRCYCLPTQHGYRLHIDDICEKDQLKMCGLLLEYNDRELDCIFEDQEELSSSIIGFLMRSDEERVEKIKNTIKNNILKYYRKRMIEILDDRLEEAQHEDNFDRGKVLRRSRIDGEVYEERI